MHSVLSERSEPCRIRMFMLIKGRCATYPKRIYRAAARPRVSSPPIEREVFQRGLAAP